jgi:hypothetical protein
MLSILMTFALASLIPEKSASDQTQSPSGQPKVQCAEVFINRDSFLYNTIRKFISAQTQGDFGRPNTARQEPRFQDAFDDRGRSPGNVARNPLGNHEYEKLMLLCGSNETSDVFVYTLKPSFLIRKNDQQQPDLGKENPSLKGSM